MTPHPDLCPSCTNPFKAGDECFFVDGGGFVHAACCDQAPIEQLPEPMTWPADDESSATTLTIEIPSDPDRPMTLVITPIRPDEPQQPAPTNSDEPQGE